MDNTATHLTSDSVILKMLKPGQGVFMRCVTYHYTGIVVEADNGFVRLKKAAWIAESGRFADAVKNEEFNEVEPYTNDICVNVQSIVDVTILSTVPTAQK